MFSRALLFASAARQPAPSFEDFIRRGNVLRTYRNILRTVSHCDNSLKKEVYQVWIVILDHVPNRTIACPS